jgi:hypothetical protein
MRACHAREAKSWRGDEVVPNRLNVGLVLPLKLFDDKSFGSVVVVVAELS